MSADTCKVTECARLLEFKDFLASIATTAGEGLACGGNELVRNCVTRSSTETYRVTAEERRAELVTAIWKQLQTKACPADFQLKILHVVTEQLEQEFRNAKERDVNMEDAEEPQHDLLKLNKLVANHLEKFLHKLTDNAAADDLQHYADAKALCLEPHNCKCALEPAVIRHTVAFIKNKPRKMEDRHVCLERYGAMYQLPDRECRFFGVFDGHSGALSACYATSQLPQLLAEQLQHVVAADRANADIYRNAFETAFLQADERFAEKRITSGTTAVCALINSSHLYIAWVGDSKALLVGQRTQLQLVKPHKPEANDERRRIEAAGGTVIHAQGQWRVNGILNVARSIGDYCVEAVIAEPDFVDVQLSEVHDFLVLGTDGLWDHVPEAHIVETVYDSLATPTIKLDDIPKLLIEAAKERDSQDNITVVIVLLKPRNQIGKA